MTVQGNHFMHSTSDTLVRMANQISKFFRAQGEDRAVAGVADHLKKFWEPRMKQAIFEYVDHGGDGLDKIALKAVQDLRREFGADGRAASAGTAAKAAVKPQVQQAKSQPPKGKQGKKATAH